MTLQDLHRTEVKIIKESLNFVKKDCTCYGDQWDPNYHDHEFFTKEENGFIICCGTNLFPSDIHSPAYAIICSVKVSNFKSKKDAYIELQKKARYN